MKERIQKLLATAGYGSRREIERWIEAGEVYVNGVRATIGQQIGEQDRVVLRGKPLHLESRLRATPKVLMYYKEAGEVCTQSDPDGRPTVFAKLPYIRQGRWVMIGRLDVNTDGLLLFTTDGELANRLMHPSSGIEREYAARVLGEVNGEMLHRLQTGVELEDGPAHFLRITDAGGEGANHWYHVILSEGRNREVRRLWESQGVKISRLTRVRYGHIKLPRYLRAGLHDELDVKSIRRLYESVGMTFEDGTLDEHKGKGASANGEGAAPRTSSRPQSRTERRADVRKATERPTSAAPTRPARSSPPAGARAKTGGNRPRPSSGSRPSR